MSKIFDPFGDFQTKGYLRNTIGKKDIQDIKSLEHMLFLTHIHSAIDWLASRPMNYETLLLLHSRLFGDQYPWAGQDRLAVLPDHTVKKGNIIFSDPENIQQHVVDALNKKSPEDLLSGLAMAHPFLEGNGRVIFLFFAEHQRRQGRLIRFDQIAKNDLGRALGKAILGDKELLKKTLFKKTVKFPITKPDSDRLSRVFSAIDWSGKGHDTPYQAKPTFFYKITSKFKK